MPSARTGSISENFSWIPNIWLPTIYNALADYIFDYLKTDDAFTRQVYKYMIEEEQLSGP